MIKVENKASSELINNLKVMIYRNCIDDFIAFSNDEVKNRVTYVIDEQMNAIRYALVNENSDVIVLREKYKILENLKKAYE